MGAPASYGTRVELWVDGEQMAVKELELPDGPSSHAFELTDLEVTITDGTIVAVVVDLPAGRRRLPYGEEIRLGAGRSAG